MEWGVTLDKQKAEALKLGENGIPPTASLGWRISVQVCEGLTFSHPPPPLGAHRPFTAPPGGKSRGWARRVFLGPVAEGWAARGEDLSSRSSLQSICFPGREPDSGFLARNPRGLALGQHMGET